MQVETPDPALDVLANGWLLYQTLACRYLARSGYYQSGGAFGFRDQLQDAWPCCTPRRQLSARTPAAAAPRTSSREGDVLHWWHPPHGPRRAHALLRRLSLAATGGLPLRRGSPAIRGVLDEVVPYLEGRAVNADEESYYDLPAQLRRSASTLYEHCVRALDAAADCSASTACR